MTATAHARGNKIYFDDKAWRYAEDNIPIAEEKPCIRCGKMPTSEGHDACLGHIEGAISACCGHGVGEPFIVYANCKREYAPTFLVLLPLPDRLILDPIPGTLVAKYYLSHGQGLPFSDGWIVEARPGSVWEKLSLTEWEWDADYWWEIGEGQIDVAALPTGYQGYRPGHKRKKTA